MFFGVMCVVCLENCVDLCDETELFVKNNTYRIRIEYTALTTGEQHFYTIKIPV